MCSHRLTDSHVHDVYCLHRHRCQIYLSWLMHVFFLLPLSFPLLTSLSFHLADTDLDSTLNCNLFGTQKPIRIPDCFVSFSSFFLFFHCPKIKFEKELRLKIETEILSSAKRPVSDVVVIIIVVSSSRLSNSVGLDHKNGIMVKRVCTMV